MRSTKSTYYKLKGKHEGMSVSNTKRLKALEEENRRLRKVYANLSLEYRFLTDIVEKNSCPSQQAALDKIGRTGVWGEPREQHNSDIVFFNSS